MATTITCDECKGVMPERIYQYHFGLAVIDGRRWPVFASLKEPACLCSDCWPIILNRLIEELTKGAST